MSNIYRQELIKNCSFMDFLTKESWNPRWLVNKVILLTMNLTDVWMSWEKTGTENKVPSVPPKICKLNRYLEYLTTNFISQGSPGPNGPKGPRGIQVRE